MKKNNNTSPSIKLLPYSKKQLMVLSFWAHPKHKDKHFIICDGSIRCIDGDTLIYDPIKKEHIKAREFNGGHVLSYDGNKLITAEAGPAVKFKKVNMYEVTTESGKKITVSAGHRFLTPSGWKDVASLSLDNLILCVQDHQESNIHYEKIQDIKYKKTDYYYDLHVPGYENYLANGIINHNSGKTLSMVDSFITWSLSEFRNAKFIIAAASMGALERNILSVLFDVLKLKGIKYEYSISDSCVYVGTNTYYCFGAPNEKSQDVLQGFTAAGFYADEVALLPESFVKQAIGRCTNTDNFKVYFNCNPESPYHWVKTEYIDQAHDKGILYLTFFLKDNPSMTPEKIKTIEKLFSGVFYRRNILAEWCLAEGLIYQNFNPETMISSDLPTFKSYTTAVDVGTQNATVFLLFGIGTDGKLWAIDEYYHSGREGTQKSPAQYSKDYKAFIEKNHVKPYALYIDPSAAGFTQQLLQDGIVGIQKANNDVLGGIGLVSSLISCDMLRIHPRCVNTIKEFAQYSWDPKAQQRGEDAPLKVSDHCLTGDTLIDTVDGQIPIRDLVGKTGTVRCYDEENQLATTSNFHDVRMTRQQADIYEIEVEDGRTIKCTGDHLILTTTGWIEAQNLTGNDDIIDIRSVRTKVKSVKYIGKEDVYNMEVDKYHNFSINGGLIVHNCMDCLRYNVYSNKAFWLSKIK